MKEVSFYITNPVWMLSCEAIAFTKRMEKFSSSITVLRGRESRNGKVFHELMKLRNIKKEKTTFKADGTDEDDAIHSINEFMKEHTEVC
jgi:phosphotransferase system HPr-like phosphotransfer protein